MPVIPALKRLRRDDCYITSHEKASLGYIANSRTTWAGYRMSPCPKKQKKEKKVIESKYGGCILYSHMKIE
jgi:hypothetical protein